MMIPGYIWLILFSVVPMFGIIMAFQDFNPSLGMFRSPLVGWENFQYMLAIRDVRQVFINTLVIAVGKIIGNLIVPLLFAILLNELKFKKYGRVIQTITYLPYFLSWVILSNIILNIFGYVGPINNLRQSLGLESVLIYIIGFQLN